MRKFLQLMILSLFIVSFIATAAFAVDLTKTGTLKSIDTKKGTIVFCPDGTKDEIKLKASKKMLKGLQGNEKVSITYDAGKAKSITKVKTRSGVKVPVGC